MRLTLQVRISEEMDRRLAALEEPMRKALGEDALARALGRNVTRSTVLRAAMDEGLEVLERRYGRRT